MLFSLEWLRAICSFEESAGRVVDLLTARGLTVDSVVETRGDAVLDVDVPANRPDCLGHLGLAREIAAGLGLRPPRAPVPTAPDAGAIAAEVEVEIEDPELCPRYTARLARGVRVGPSPDWVVRRLEACGVRSLNNVIDASNLVLLELGHPVHFFDAARLPRDDRGRRLICVRRALAGETLRTLDGVVRSLDPEVLVIADAERAIALAGVMGGRDTEIVEASQDVLVEAACFHPQIVRAASRKLVLPTDASYRFERGVDPEGPRAAQALSMRLLAELAGGSPVSGTVDRHPAPVAARKLTLRVERVHRLLGYRPTDDEIVASLDAVELRPESAGGRIEVTVPSWRTDLGREADLVEEVARHLGYDRIPAPGADLAPVGVPARRVEERCRDVLAAHGFHEGLGYSMIGQGEDAGFVSSAESGDPFVLTNPIAEPLAVLRRSMLPALLRSADANFRRGTRDVRLFEVGHVFLREPGSVAPREPSRAGLAWAGAGRPRHWSEPDREVDLQDVTGIVDLLLESCCPGAGFEREPCALPTFHPGSAVRWKDAGDRTVARAGALHPEIQERLDHELFLAEIDFDLLRAATRPPPVVRRLTRFPAVTRDLALVLSAEHAFAQVTTAMRSVPAPAPVGFEAVDRYVGPPLDPGQSSLTVRFVLEPTERTLTDDETEGYRSALVRTLERTLGVRTRQSP